MCGMTDMTSDTSYIEHACTLAMSRLGDSGRAHAAARRTSAPLPSAILLVPGSLFSDVNGDYPTWNSFPHVYAHLARQLSARGHAVYRFAKLGPGHRQRGDRSRAGGDGANVGADVSRSRLRRSTRCDRELAARGVQRRRGRSAPDTAKARWS